MERSPAIVACCSKAGLAIIRALGARGIPIVGIAYGRGQIGLASRFTRAHARCADPAENEEELLQQLESHARDWGRGVVFPSDDASLVALSGNRERLGKNYYVAAE